MTHLSLVSQEWEKALRQKLYENAMDLAFSQALQEILLQSLDSLEAVIKQLMDFKQELASYRKIIGGSLYLKNLENLEQMSLRNLQTYGAPMKLEYLEYPAQLHYQRLSE